MRLEMRDEKFRLLTRIQHTRKSNKSQIGTLKPFNNSVNLNTSELTLFLDYAFS